MSNQELQSQEKTTEEAALETRRRFIKGAGIAAPVVLSLANRSAFGAPCLSEQMSGNMSHHGTGSCLLGYAPCIWKLPAIGSSITKIYVDTNLTTNSKIQIDKIVLADYGTTVNDKIHIKQTKVVTTETYKWFGTNRIFGILTITDTSTTVKKMGGNTDVTNANYCTSGNDGADVAQEVKVKSFRSCTGDLGTVAVNDKFQRGRILEISGGANPAKQVTSPDPLATLTRPSVVWNDFTGGIPFNDPILQGGFGQGVSTSMREILNSSDSAQATCVAALLNASTISGYAGGTPADVIARCNGSSHPSDALPPGFSSLDAFYRSTFIPC
jgi:hypothetical protein